MMKTRIVVGHNFEVIVWIIRILPTNNLDRCAHHKKNLFKIPQDIL